MTTVSASALLLTMALSASAFSPSPSRRPIIALRRAEASESSAVMDKPTAAEPKVVAAAQPEASVAAVDPAAMWAKEDFSSFSTPPEELLAKAKEFLSEQSFEKQGSWMSDTDFKFVGPVVGPLGKEEYLKAISGFDVFGIFPDLNPNYYGLTVDPMEEGRVWAISRTSATNTETLEPIESPPQAISVTFNKEGKVTKFTIGAVMDRTTGNTGGLGGLFGPLYAIGKGLPFPEAQPFKPSKRYRAFMLMGKIASKLAAKKEEK
jgi:hypothetical protein